MTQMLNSFDMGWGTWIYPTHSPPPRWGHTAVLQGGEMLAFGGADGAEVTNDILSFALGHPAAHLHAILPSDMEAPCPRMFHSAVIWRNLMVIFGGWHPVDAPALNDTYAWDCSTRSWGGPLPTAGPPPDPRWGHSAVVYCNKMVVFGGCNEHHLLSDLHTLDLEAAPATWSGPIPITGSPPPVMAGHTASMCGDQMLLFGGIHCMPSTVDKSHVAPLVYAVDMSFSSPVYTVLATTNDGPSARFGHCVMQLASTMVIHGGCTTPGGAPGMRCASDVWLLDCSETPALWTQLATQGEPPTGRQSHSAVLHAPSGSIFVLGGTSCNVVPFAAVMPLRRITIKIHALKTLHCLHLKAVLPNSTPQGLVDNAFYRAATSIHRVHLQRQRHGGRIPTLFIPLTQFLSQYTSGCLGLIADLRELLNYIFTIAIHEETLQQLQIELQSHVEMVPPGATLADHEEEQSKEGDVFAHSQELDHELLCAPEAKASTADTPFDACASNPHGGTQHGLAMECLIFECEGTAAEEGTPGGCFVQSGDKSSSTTTLVHRGADSTSMATNGAWLEQGHNPIDTSCAEVSDLCHGQQPTIHAQHSLHVGEDWTGRLASLKAGVDGTPVQERTWEIGQHSTSSQDPHVREPDEPMHYTSSLQEQPIDYALAQSVSTTRTLYSPLCGTDALYSETQSSASDMTDPWRCAHLTGTEWLALRSLIDRRNEIRDKYMAGCEAMLTAALQKDVTDQVEKLCDVYVPKLQGIWELLCGGTTASTVSIAKEQQDSSSGFERCAAEVEGGIQAVHGLITSFLLAEAKEACSLGAKTDDAANALAVGVENLAALLLDESEADVPLEKLVETVETVALAEHLWLAQQPQRAQRWCGKIHAAVGDLLLALRALEVVACKALRWLSDVQVVYSEIQQHCSGPPPITDIIHHQEKLDTQCRNFWVAKAEFSSLRRSKSAKGSALGRAEQRLYEQRSYMQQLRRQDEEMQRTLVGLCMEHLPELPLLDSKLGWLREAVAPTSDHSMDDILFADREFEDYEVISCWTQGRHLVYLVTFEDQKCCLKEYIVSSTSTFRREVRLLQRLHHPNLLPLQGVLWNEADRKAYLQFPWCLCTMKDWLKTKPSDDSIRSMTAQLLIALAHLHSHGVAHCNVTLGNALIGPTGTRVLLSAFDVTKDATQRGQMMMAGRELRYVVPPEVRAGQPVTTAADLWSFGHLLAAAYTSGSAHHTAGMLPSGKVPPQLIVLLRALFQEDPMKRLTAEQALQSPYYSTTKKVSDQESCIVASKQLEEEWRTVQSVIDKTAMATSAACETQTRLQQRAEFFCDQSAALAHKRRRALLSEHLAILNLEQQQLDRGWERLAVEWSEWLEFALKLDEERQCTQQQCMKMNHRQEMEAVSHIHPKTQAVLPLHWTFSVPRRHQTLVPAPEHWREMLQGFLQDRLSGTHLSPQLLSMYHNENAALWTAYHQHCQVIRMQMAGMAEEEGLVPSVDPVLSLRMELDQGIHETLLFLVAKLPYSLARWGTRFSEIGCMALQHSGVVLTAEPIEDIAGSLNSEDNVLRAMEVKVIVVRACLGLVHDASEEEVHHSPLAPCVQSCPPQVACAHRHYHSAVALSNGRKQWVVFDPQQCYPEFLLSFQVTERPQEHPAAASVSSVAGSSRPKVPHLSLSFAQASCSSSPPATTLASEGGKDHAALCPLEANPMPPTTVHHGSIPPSPSLSRTSSQSSLATTSSMPNPSIQSPQSSNQHGQRSSVPKPVAQAGARPKRAALRGYDFASQFSNFMRGFERK